MSSYHFKVFVLVKDQAGVLDGNGTNYEIDRWNTYTFSSQRKSKLIRSRPNRLIDWKNIQAFQLVTESVAFLLAPTTLQEFHDDHRGRGHGPDGNRSSDKPL